MLQRGRVPRTNLMPLPLDVEQRRLEPPASLSSDEKKLFAELVGACRATHFTPSDEPLLISFVQATLLARKSIKTAARDRDALMTWERATKLQGMLATKLRLAPQSRIDALSAARGRPSLPIAKARPWEEG
jgi:hypothetical protein